MLVLGHECLEGVEGRGLGWGVGGAESIFGEVSAGGVGGGELGTEFRDGEIVGVDLGGGDSRKHFGFEG